MYITNEELPVVSIVTPVYNAENEVSKLLDSLVNQDYLQDLLEIIIVDNKSTDRTRELVKEYPVTLLEENEVQGSYAAHNKGVKYVKGEIIAFVDSDCIVSPQWLKEGIRLFMEQDADLVGGKVEFYFSDNKSAAEMYDSITNMQIGHNIKERNVAKTANLFVKISLFDEIGMFPHHATSGGDVQWTAMATRAGHKLVYTPCAIVKHLARTLNELLKKQYNIFPICKKSCWSHDYWLSTVYHAVGKVISVDKPLMYYRIHDSNISGKINNPYVGTDMLKT